MTQPTARARRSPETLSRRRRAEHARPRTRRARAASRWQRVLGLPERRSHSQHRRRRSSSAFCTTRPCAARRWPRSRRNATSTACTSTWRRSCWWPPIGRGRAAGQPARHRACCAVRASQIIDSNWVESCVAPEDRAAARTAFRALLMSGSDEPQISEYHVRAVRRRGSVHHLARRGAARCQTMSPPASCSRARTSPTSGAPKAKRTARSSA